jgi:adenine-specific DNA-methyltransferase
MKTTTLDGKTLDIAEENIEKLKQLFPEVFTEGKVDFEKLQQVLGEYVEDSNERYNFTWNGKGRALRLSQTPSLGTLRPCKEESKDWDTTQNLYIEGDNLEVLKLLQKSYYGKVKMIYIDPPYNTGKDFVYKDDFHDSLENYKRITGQVDGDGKAVSTNTETSGRYHTDWLNMMYPRLRLARNLLSDDGVIFISIDDNEVANLIKVCDEVFGEENFIAKFDWRKKTGANDAKDIAIITESVLSYARSKIATHDSHIWRRDPNSRNEERFNRQDEFVSQRGKYYLDTLDRGGLGYVESLDFGIKAPNGKEIFPNNRTCKFNDGWRWKWGKDKVNWGLENGFLEFVKDDSKASGYSVKLKNYQFVDNNNEVREEVGRVYLNLILDPINQIGTNEIKKIFNNQIVFNNPKPVDFIIKLIQTIDHKDLLVLDFFSGSSSTAHAIMQLNAEDGGNRKYIMVQLPELTDVDSEAYKAGYMNICEIGKERIRRAGEKIKEEKGLEAMNLDVGFKVLKLDSSNIRKWQPDYNDLEQSLMDYVDNYVEGRTELDVVYEIMLKYGLDLTYPVDEFTIEQKKVYSIGFGMLMICLDDEITTEVAKGILGKIKELSPESSRVVFKDNGFKSDSNKTNIKEILKSGGIEEFITI